MVVYQKETGCLNVVNPEGKYKSEDWYGEYNVIDFYGNPVDCKQDYLGAAVDYMYDVGCEISTY
ncbi:hypothetical protein [Butyrivibrio proteoclasticus]|uniref:hypothetical protein n=1 Tax=Butyrivibrio proteoclasticus TaxID=43305 RepID=UPI00047BA0B9|nr:hypothetical protein [Butyrivibrio proteoclasticus]